MDILVKWNNPNPDYEGTRIYRSDEPLYDTSDMGAAITTTDTGVTQYLDTDLVEGQNYYYRFETFRGDDAIISDMLTVKAVRYTGPGPQELVFGDAELGFYGEVEDYDLFTTEQLLAQLPTFDGDMVRTASPITAWLKFAYLGKILFISKNVRKIKGNWKSLYDAGLVFGVDGFGTELVTPGVNQMVTLRLGGDDFSVSIPSAAPNYNATKTTYAPSHIDDLILRVVNHIDDNQIGENIAELTGVAGPGINLHRDNSSGYVMCRETDGTSAMQRISIHLPSGKPNYKDQRIDRIVSNPYGMWLPVLELI